MNSQKIRCLVIDDEPIARKIIRNYIDQIEFLELSGEAKNAIEALDFLKTNDQIDIAFLDINMPSLSGIAMLKMLENPPQIIFTTAYTEYAIESYELNAVDYLLKPFSLERFSKAILKAKNNIQLKNKDDDSIIQIKSDGKIYFIDVSDILFCEAMRNYTKVFLKNGKNLMPLISLSKFEDNLINKSTNFIRVHRSFIISKKHITAVKGNTILILENKIPIGFQFKKNFV